MSARDSFSPITPARIRVLVLPVGRIKRSRFMAFFNLLAQTNEVRLGDVSADARPDRTMFSPLHFPDGVLFYDFATSQPSPTHLALSPFELFREPFVVLGLADWSQYAPHEIEANQGESDTIRARNTASLDEFEGILADLRETHSRILLHKVLLFDSPFDVSRDSKIDGLMHIPSAEQRKSTTMKTVVCDITSGLLAEMTTLAKSLQALPSITSPTQSQKPINGAPISQRFRDATLVRTNSLGAARARSASPAIHDDVNLHRMSMPNFVSTNSASSSPTRESRPISPDLGLRKIPARTFEEITASSSVPELQKTSGKRSASQERVSIHGFGSGSLDEWNRNKGQCRIGIVIASLYLQAGRWRDAMKEFIDNALKAKAFSDHLWHAKALESIMVCMILLAWAHLDFQIPPICYPIPDRSSKATQSTTIMTAPDTSSPTGSGPTRPGDLQTLAQVVPDLANMILSIYSRPLSVTGESLPELAFSETTIRLSKTLAALHLAGGTFNDQILRGLVHGDLRKLESTALGACRLTIAPTRSSIESILLRAYPESGESSDLSALDRVTILAGMASIFSTLGLQRKKALMVQEYMEALTQAINDSKKIDAAQAGYHPSASVSSFSPVVSNFDLWRNSGNGDDSPEVGLEDFLNLLCRVHGIPEAKWSETVGFEALHGELANGVNGDEAGDPKAAQAPLSLIPDMLVGNFVLRSFGSVNIKADVLRACIRLCEVLSDIGGLLHYTAALLRTAGPGIAPSFDSGDSLITLSREEQLSLISTITKTVADASVIGLNAEAEFWDEFLVRGLYLLEQPSNLALSRQKHSDLTKGKGKRGPASTFRLVHNPFASKGIDTETKDLVVAGEEREFVVTLQNPYEFDVDVECIRILSQGTVIGSSDQGFVLRPSRTQSFSVLGSVAESGSISIDGCLVKVRSCRERRFAIFSEPWTPAAEIKMKNIGLLKAQSQKSRPKSDESTSSQISQTALSSFPAPSVVPLTILPPQPNISVAEYPPSHSALMLLEGERRKVSISLRNHSSTVAADFLQVSFADTSSAAMLDAIANGNLPPSELHEFEYQLIHHPAIRLSSDTSLSIKPGETKAFEFEILGKPGLTHANATFRYANVSMPHVEDKDAFYSRLVTVSFAITVNASVQLHRFDVLPLSGDLPGILSLSPQAGSSSKSTNTHDQQSSLLTQMQLASREQSIPEHFLAVLDLRNGWPAPIQASVFHEREDQNTEQESVSPIQNIQELIQPGHISRFVLLVPKLYLTHPHHRIKPLNPENERQFVVSTTSVAPEIERMNRELFWHREALLKLFRAEWKLESHGRNGDIDLRALRLSPRMLDTIRLDDFSIEFEVIRTDGREALTRRISHSTFEVRVEEDLILRTSLKNRSDKTIYPLLRIRPSWTHAPHEHHIDLGKRMIWDGVLQKTLPPLGPKKSAFNDTSMCVTCSGEIEIGAIVEEYRFCKSSEDEGAAERPRAATGTILDTIDDIPGRRTWTASQSCRIIVKDV